MMHIIIGIIVFLVILSMLKELLENLLPYIIGLAILVGFGALIVFLCKTFGVGTVVGFIISFTVVLAIIVSIREAIDKRKRKKNEKQLMDYLNRNCKELGYMNSEEWNRKLYQFRDKPYPEGTSFSTIVETFAKECEKKYIPNSIDWILPFEELFKKDEMVSMYKMIYEPIYEPLKYTHTTNDQVLIKRQIDKFLQMDSCKVEKKFVHGDDNEFRKKNNVHYSVALTEDLKTIYTLKQQYLSFTERPVIHGKEEDISDFLDD